MQVVSAFDVSASGMAAERLRMEVVANNIANANSTRSSDGGPFRRQQVVIAPSFQDVLQGSSGRMPMGGVEIVGVEGDKSEFPRVYEPGHPDADAEGFVTMPNVAIANEMVDLITASRGYEANLQALRTMRTLVEQSLTVLRGN